MPVGCHHVIQRSDCYWCAGQRIHGHEVEQPGEQPERTHRRRTPFQQERDGRRANRRRWPPPALPIAGIAGLGIVAALVSRVPDDVAPGIALVSLGLGAWLVRGTVRHSRAGRSALSPASPHRRPPRGEP